MQLKFEQLYERLRINLYIKNINSFIEFCEDYKPEFIIFDKNDTNFEINMDLKDFTVNSIYSTLPKTWIKKVTFIVNSCHFKETYKNVEEKIPIMKAFPKLDDAFEYIKKI